MKHKIFAIMVFVFSFTLICGCDWIKWGDQPTEEEVVQVAATPAPALTTKQKEEAAQRLVEEAAAGTKVRRLYGLGFLLIVTICLIWVLVLKIRELDRARTFNPPKQD